MRLSLAETESSDQELVAAVASGSEEALRTLFHRHGGALMALARRMLGSREEAEEVVVDTYLRLWRHAERFEPERAALRTYLYAVTRNLCISRLRARQARPQIQELDPESHAYATAFSHTVDQVAGALARRALDALDEQDRELMLEAYYGGWSQSELAERHGMPLGTVKSRMRRALARMRAALEGQA